MKQSHLILGVILLCIVVFVSMGKEEVQSPPSSYRPNPRQNPIGFVKPEHRLLKIFSSLSAGPKVKLGGICSHTIYNKNTLPVGLRETAIGLAKRLLNSVQQISQQEYYLKKLENIYHLRDRAGNQRFILDFFIYDVRNFYTIRLIADAVILNGITYLNYLNIQTASNSTLLNKYDMKFNSTGILFGNEMFQENIGSLFDTMYMNAFKVIGVNDTSLEYTKEDLTEVVTLEALETGYMPSHLSQGSVQDLQEKGLDSYTEMYLPSNQETIKDPLFCKKYKIEWDSYGIPYERDDVPDSCIRHNNQARAKINDPWFGPGLMYDRSSEDAYKWLKEPGRGNLVRTHGYHQ
jgi:hypothetical protein